MDRSCGRIGHRYAVRRWKRRKRRLYQPGRFHLHDLIGDVRRLGDRCGDRFGASVFPGNRSGLPKSCARTKRDHSFCIAVQLPGQPYPVRHIRASGRRAHSKVLRPVHHRDDRSRSGRVHCAPVGWSRGPLCAVHGTTVRVSGRLLKKLRTPLGARGLRTISH